ncbi:MAG: hypothetical protein WC459_03355 [Patescibacteria group bacterium]
MESRDLKDDGDYLLCSLILDLGNAAVMVAGGIVLVILSWLIKVGWGFRLGAVLIMLLLFGIAFMEIRGIIKRIKQENDKQGG